MSRIGPTTVSSTEGRRTHTGSLSTPGSATSRASPAPASALVLGLLGPPVITVDGSPLDVDTRKAVGLLAYLAIEGATPRDRVAALLWPDSDDSRARSTLRRTLSVLSKGLGGRWVSTVGMSLTLSGAGPRTETGDDVDCDLWAFRDALAATRDHDPGLPCGSCMAQLAKAVTLHRGDFLAGFVLRDAPAFDDWQRAVSVATTRELTGALDRLITGLGAAGRFDEAIGHGTRRLDLDPLDERTHRRLMLLHAWSGARAEAVRQYRECVAALNRELGVPPLDETRELYESILADDLPPLPAAARTAEPPATPPPPPTQVPGRLPLVARGPALATIAAFTDPDHRHDDRHDEGTGLGSGGSTVLVIEGEAGVGRSRLLEEVTASGKSRGASVLSARCLEVDRASPHALTVELLRSAVRAQAAAGNDLAATSFAGDLGRLLPEFAGREPLMPLDSPAARARFTRVLVEVIARAVTTDGHGLIAIDDAQWVDAASARVLAQLVDRAREIPLRLALTWRTGDDTARDLARRTITGAAEHTTVLTLGRLSPDAVCDLVLQVLPAAAAHVDRLYEESEGLPLIVSDYLLALHELDDPSQPWPLPRGTQEHLAARLAGLSALQRQVITAAAILGRTVDPDLLRHVSGRTEDEVADALDALVARGLLTEVGGNVTAGAGKRPEGVGGRYDFTHDKLRHTLVAQTSLARRRLLHGRVVDALASSGRDRSPAASLAHHAERAGRDREAADHHRTAADHARSVGALTQSIEHLEHALALDHPDVADLRQLLGELRTLTGDYRGAIADLELAAALASVDQRPVIEQLLAGVHLRRGDRAAADAHLGAALALLGDEGSLPQRSRLLADRALAALRDHDDHDATALADEALQLAERAGDRTALTQCHNLLGMLCRRRGELAHAREHVQRSLELAIALGHVDARVASMNNLGLIARAAGDLEESVRLHEEACALAQPLGDRHREAALLNNLADALHAAGRRDDAMATLKSAVTAFAELGEPARDPEIWQLVEW